jgi:4-nitrophenyl phosphatase
MLILLDADGVLWRGAEVIPQAPEFIRRMHRAGHRCVLVSNNAGPSRTDYAAKCRNLGLDLAKNDMFTVNYLAGPWIAARYPGARVLLIGSPQLTAAIEAAGVDVTLADAWLADHGLTTPDGAPTAGRGPGDVGKLLAEDAGFDAVLMGMDTHVSYMHLALASVAVQHGAKLLGANEDLTYPIPGGLLLPGNGSMVRLVSDVAGGSADYLGKPNTYLLELIETETHTPRSEMLMIGDRWETDIEFAVRGGIPAWLVLTGVTQANQVAGPLPAGVSIAPTLDEVAAELHTTSAG